MLLAVIFATVLIVITSAAIINRRLPYIAIAIAVAVFAVLAGIVLPRVFRYAKVTVGEKDIISIRGIFTERTFFMPVDAVRSVTLIVTPFGEVTGLNLVILNAMGAKMVLPFLTKTDSLKIYAHINSEIKKRTKSDDT